MVSWCVRHFPIFRTLVPRADSGTRITLLHITSRPADVSKGISTPWRLSTVLSTVWNRSVIYRWRMPLRSFIHSQLKWVKNRTFRIWDKVTLRLWLLKQCIIHPLLISTFYCKKRMALASDRPTLGKWKWKFPQLAEISDSGRTCATLLLEYFRYWFYNVNRRWLIESSWGRWNFATIGEVQS